MQDLELGLTSKAMLTAALCSSYSDLNLTGPESVLPSDLPIYTSPSLVLHNKRQLKSKKQIVVSAKFANWLLYQSEAN